LLFASSSLWLAPLLQKTAYDPLRELAPVSLVIAEPNLLGRAPVAAGAGP